MLTLPTARAWVFAVRTFGAAMLALWIAFRLGLDRPYWAMATAYIVAQPLTGAMRSKSLYRFAGTLLGAAAAVALVPTLVNAPVLLTLALALWAGGCLFFALLDRTPRSYLFMLAGYTAAIIGFPSVDVPGAIFDTALLRVEEITLGIASVAVTGSLVFPVPLGPALVTRIVAWRTNALEWAHEALAGRPGFLPRRRLAADAVEVDLLGSQIAFDQSRFQRATRPLRALRLRMVTLVAVLSSVADRVDGIERERGMLPALREVLAAIEGWMRLGGDTAPLRARIGALLQPVAAGADWCAIMRTSLLLRLLDLVDIWEDAETLREQIGAGRPQLPPLRYRRHSGAPAQFRDYGMALFSAASATVAICLICWFWIASAWAYGAVAAEMVAVACSFFAAQDDPVPAILRFMTASAAAVAVDAVYLFAILPVVQDFTMLVLALAPFFVLCALLSAAPRTAPIGMALTVNGATLLSLQETYNADFGSFANSALAFVAGLGAAAVITRLIRSVGAEWSARHLLRQCWADIAAAAEAQHPADPDRFEEEMVDRLRQLVPRLAAVEPGADLATLDLLADLRVGLHVLDLSRERAEMPLPSRGAVVRVEERVAWLFRRRAAKRRFVPPGDDLLGAVDDAIGTVAASPPDGRRRKVLHALVGIRRGLYPAATPYAPPSSTQVA